MSLIGELDSQLTLSEAVNTAGVLGDWIRRNGADAVLESTHAKLITAAHDYGLDYPEELAEVEREIQMHKRFQP